MRRWRRRAGLAAAGAGVLLITACGAGGMVTTAGRFGASATGGLPVTSQTPRAAQTPPTSPTPPASTTATTPVPKLSAAPPAQAAPSLTRAQIDGAVARLDGVIRDTMAKTGVPGLSVAVVHQDRTLYLKGYGVRGVGDPQPVGPDTVFQLASVSKPLASTVVAGVVGGGTVAWDDPVIKHDPGFSLKDPWVSRHVTLADLFAHRSGLPDHAGDLLEDLGYGRPYIVGHLRYEPLAPFRASYAYTNFGLTAAAEAVAQARGVTWEELSAQVLYRPLGMKSTSSLFSDYANAPDRAFLHVKVDGRWEATYTRDPQAQSPAGGASSTARDMVAWMRLQLGDGKFGSRTVIDAAALDQTHLPQIVSMPPRAPYGEAGFYGLGWNVNYDALGRLRLNHSGGFDQGAATTVTLLPTEGLGIVVLTNGEPVGVPETVAEIFFDIAQHGRQTVDWLPLIGKLFAKMDVAGRSKIDYTRPPADATQAHAPDVYVGTYDNAYYGPMQVTSTQDGLVMRLGPQGMAFPLRHYDGDTFSYVTQGENAVGLSGVRFTVREAGQATAVTVEHLNQNSLGTFIRRR
ncbi:serine hydrolase [Nonomuraea sp. NPDC049152]|uniref:serine hydrolase n=1 Tax=Nonomuraea sp. NPDC049152 TaxID=3154350 RepID=UPI0033CAEB26